MLQDYVALCLTVYLGNSIGSMFDYPCCSTYISLLLSPSSCWIGVCFVQFRTMFVTPAHLRSILWKSSGARVCNDGKWYFQQVWRENDRGFLWQLQIQLEPLPGRNVRQHARRRKLTEKAQFAAWSLIFHAADELCRRGLQRRGTGRSTTRRGTWC